MVPWAGVEPARSFERGILSPLRLPISPPRQINLISRLLYRKIKNTLLFFVYKRTFFSIYWHF
ncbi:MAG: hypothetical protein RL755_528 [Pseudomonadota bacterium]